MLFVDTEKNNNLNKKFKLKVNKNIINFEKEASFIEKVSLHRVLNDVSVQIHKRWRYRYQAVLK